jgi:hypothetical protein
MGNAPSGKGDVGKSSFIRNRHNLRWGSQSASDGASLSGCLESTWLVLQFETGCRALEIA